MLMIFRSLKNNHQFELQIRKAAIMLRNSGKYLIIIITVKKISTLAPKAEVI